METPRYHEIVQPVRDIVRGIGEFVLNKIIPEDVINGINEIITGQSAERTQQMFEFPPHEREE